MTLTSAPGYTEHQDVPYAGTEDPARQSLDLYLPPNSCSASPLLVYIHGGAWRSESKADCRQTLVPSLIASTSLPLAVVEYRLAPASPHPAQAHDVLSALALLSSSALLESENGEPRWDRTNLVLMGHSAGAFVALSIVLTPPPGVRSLFQVSADVRRAVAGVVCVDGIYDLPDLLSEYPTYSYFVEDAFGTDPAAQEADSPARWTFASRAEGGRPVRILVLHSKDDELLSLRQPYLLLGRLGQLPESNGGAAEIEEDYDSLKGAHDDVVKREELPKVVGAWLKFGEALKCKE